MYLKTKEYKLEDIASVITGLPLQRYVNKEDSIKQKVIKTMPFFMIGKKFETEEEEISEDIKERFYSQEHDILYKVQQPSFAKEITTEKGAIISNNYNIIRVDSSIVNSTFLTYYLNDPRVDYEIQRTIDSTRIMKVSTRILKDLKILLPEKEEQDKQATIIKKVNERIELKNKSIECDEKLINSLYDDIIGDTYEN